MAPRWPVRNTDPATKSNWDLWRRRDDFAKLRKFVTSFSQKWDQIYSRFGHFTISFLSNSQINTFFYMLWGECDEKDLKGLLCISLKTMYILYTTKIIPLRHYLWSTSVTNTFLPHNPKTPWVCFFWQGFHCLLGYHIIITTPRVNRWFFSSSLTPSSVKPIHWVAMCGSSIKLATFR